MKHLGSAVFNIYVRSAHTGWRCDGPFSQIEQVISWTTFPMMNYCLLPCCISGLCCGTRWFILGGKSQVFWGWSIKQPETTRRLRGDLSAAQPGASSSLKHVKMMYKILLPRIIHSMKMLWYFNILSRVITETNTKILEIPVGWNSCEARFCT